MADNLMSYMEVYKKTPFFAGLNEKQIEAMLRDNMAVLKTYSRGEVLFHEGDKMRSILILIKGSVTIAKDTAGGKRMIFTTLEKPGDMYGDLNVYVNETKYDMYGEANAATTVLYINRCVLGGSGIEYIIARNNLLKVFANRAFEMSSRLRILSGGSLREKIARYIFENQKGSPYISVPPREELADYLNVTRPSLSREISNMVADGLIETDGRTIRVLDKSGIEKLL